MRIAIASDHAGFGYKTRIIEHLEGLGHEVVDFGTRSAASVDYPAYVHPAASAVAGGDCERGIVLGGSGNGEAMAANRHSGVRCALCWSEESARLARAHNDANMLSLGERMISDDLALRIVDAWLTTPFEGGRHVRRIQAIDEPGRVPALVGAAGPAPEHAEKLMLYGQFVGSWDIECTWYEREGSARTASGEWHFGWILGGRGVQDVLFPSGVSRDQYGTTIRGYDTASDTWHICWMQPWGGEFVYLVGRAVGDRIVQEVEGPHPGRLERWSFTEITPRSFVWLGEVSSDDGLKWFVEQEMRARRRNL
ncbi:MAG: ribose 5-phosphate isomerase B [Thermoleophilia bacterium]|nr:ribose 5-phosphate isomerase B [Thermoleophilia bacterium]